MTGRVILSSLPPPPCALRGLVSCQVSCFPLRKKGEWKLLTASLNNERNICFLQLIGHFHFSVDHRDTHTHTDAHTHTSGMIEFFSSIFCDATHISGNHKTDNFQAVQILFICSLTRGVFLRLFFWCSQRCYLPCVFYFTCASWRPGKNQWCNRAFFIIVFWLFHSFFFSNWKNNIHRSFDLQDHGRKYVFEK